jgi:hypothetical protein
MTLTCLDLEVLRGPKCRPLRFFTERLRRPGRSRLFIFIDALDTLGQR